MISNFEDVTEKECIKYDRINQDNYNNLLLKAKQAQYTIRDSGLSMNLEVPLPPRPCNRDRLILWRKRNISKPVIEQSNAIVFLIEQGYVLNKHFEAYQAIDLANEIKRKKGIKTHYKDVSKDFDDIYTQKDRNIFRRRSMYNVERMAQHDTNVGFNNQGDNFPTLNNLYGFLDNNASVKLRNPMRRRNVNTINFDEYEKSLQQLQLDFTENKSNDILINTIPSAPSAPVEAHAPLEPSAPSAPLSECQLQLPRVLPSIKPSSTDEINEINMEKPCLDNIDFNKRSSLYYKSLKIFFYNL